MPAVVIQSIGYSVYADVGEADVYMFGSFPNTTWFNQTEDAKAQLLVAATRTLDRQCWLGEKTLTSGQDLEWPRTGTGVEGVEDDIVPQDIIDGSIELANQILLGSTVQNSITPNAQGINSLKAGSVEIVYFRPGQESAFAQNSRFPTIVQELVGKYLCGASLAVLGAAFGTGTTTAAGQSVTNDDEGYSDPI